MNCDDARSEIGVALLTREPLDTPAAMHVQTCGACTQEIDELRTTASLLALASAPTSGQPQPQDPELLGRLLEAAATRQRGRRRLALTSIAAAVLVIALIGGVGVFARQSNYPQAPIERSAASATTGVAGVVDLRPTSTGSTIDVSVEGVRRGTTCTLTAITSSGGRVLVTRWRANYSGSGRANAFIPVSTADVTRLELTDDSGRILLPFTITRT